MGIVVAVCLVLGLLAMCFPTRITGKAASVIALLVAALGGWNVFWYGLRNLDQLWGWIALGSGVVMLLSSSMILSKNDKLA